MSRFFGQLKYPPRKKPAKWNLDPKEVDLRWRHVWNDACLVWPVWTNTSGILPGREYVQNEVTEHETAGASRSWEITEHGVTASYPDHIPHDEIPANTTLNLCHNEPIDACTVLFVRNRLTSADRSASHFGIESTGSGSDLGAHVPWSDENIYWNFASGTNRPAWTGYTNSTALEFWTFTAGHETNKIYLNGDLKATGAGDGSRASTATKAQMWVNKGINLISGEGQNVYLFALFNVQWSAGQISDWSQDPYGFIREAYPARRSRNIPVPAAAAPAAGPTLRHPIEYHRHNLTR